jgi:hypothetical protein
MVSVAIIENAKRRVLLDHDEDLRKDFVVDKNETKTGGFE